MITSRNKAPEREDIEALLPWHAAGTLSRRDAERVEQALAQDAELARRFELVREEMAETIHLNETLGAPSTRAAQKLFAAIEAEGESKTGRTLSFQASGWLAGLIEQLSPRTLAWSAAAAGLAIVLQAGLLAGLVLSERGATYQTASFGEPTAAAAGAFALVRFNPAATAADLTKFLDSHEASVVDGPRAGGVYRIRVAATSLSKDELAKVVARLGEDKNIVAFIAPAQ
jgi:anti-sigma factor RsiW